MAKNKNGYKAPKVTWKRDFQRNWVVYLFFVPILVIQIIFHYIPMFGIVMAFENFQVAKGFFGSPFVGLDNFKELFFGAEFPNAIKNTVLIGLLKATIGFIAPIIFAFLLSLLRSKKYKRTVQTLSYLPNFVAAVIVAAILREFVAKDGPITLLFHNIFGTENMNLLASTKEPVFKLIYLFMGIWQSIGWGSIMYVSAIATVSGDLHEAAAIDGATRLQRLFKITLPCILPTIVMMMVLNVGLCFSVGFDSIILLYMPSTYPVAYCVYTYTYRYAFGGAAPNYGLSSASGLFQSIIATILLVGSNNLSRKMVGSSLF